MEVPTRSEADGLRMGEERTLCVLPLFHIYSLTVVMLLGFRMGYELVRPPALRGGGCGARHRPQEDHRLSRRADDACGDPQLCPASSKMDFSSLRFCGSGGAPLPIAVKEQWDGLIGRPIVEGWGMTETSPIGTFTPRDARYGPVPAAFPIPAPR